VSLEPTARPARRDPAGAEVARDPVHDHERLGVELRGFHAQHPRGSVADPDEEGGGGGEAVHVEPKSAAHVGDRRLQPMRRRVAAMEREGEIHDQLEAGRVTLYSGTRHQERT